MIPQKQKPIFKDMKLPKPNEFHIHIQCAEWLRRQFNDKIPWWHTPNGEMRERKFNKSGGSYSPTGLKLKRMGAKPGVPDFTIMVPRGTSSGLFIEIKAEKGYLSDHQKQMIKSLEAHGYTVKIARSLEEFMGIVNHYLYGHHAITLPPIQTEDNTNETS